MSEAKIYSVSEITRMIKLLLEENMPTIWLEGEVSNFKAHYSGHYYFTLKDQNAQISAVVWKSRAAQIPFELEDGMMVHVLGNIRLYERSGRYQIDIVRMQPAGMGILQLEFEKLKTKLLQEGLFDPELKKALPPFPERIGIVTSSTGAALRDIINILQRRAPQAEIIIRPAKVQGSGAAEDIAAGIEELNRYKNVDVIIAGRGGGSLEDLWAFNEEIVARAIFSSKIPVVSAVGHEIDFTIADFVADLRAPTPSAAAELIVPDYIEIRNLIIEYRSRQSRSIYDKIERLREKIIAIPKSYGLKRPEDLVKQYAFRLDELGTNLQKNYQNLLYKCSEQVKNLENRLHNLNPKNVLNRGYSLAYIDGRVVSGVDDIGINDELHTEFSNGSVKSVVRKILKKGRK